MATSASGANPEDIDAKLDRLLDRFGFRSQGQHADLYAQAMQLLDTPEKKQQLYDDCLAYTMQKPSLANYVDLWPEVLSFSKDPDNDYHSGTQGSVVSAVNRQKAAEFGAAFLDVYHIVNQNSDRRADVVNAELAGQPQDKLLTGILSINLGDDNKILENFMKALSDSKQNFSQIVIPIGCHEPGKVGHAFSLIIEGSQAEIIDQIGYSTYAATHNYIEQKLSAFGIDTSVNGQPLSKNRADCAVFASLINEKALQDNLDDFFDDFDELSQDDKWQLIDAHHAKEKNLAAQAYYSHYQNNPLFELYLQTQGITDFAYQDNAAKEAIIKQFRSLPQDNTFNVDELTPSPQDAAWKAEIDAKFVPNAQAMSRNYQRFDTADDPELRYRLNNNLIYFYDRSHSKIHSDHVQDYVLLLKTAKDLGHNTVNFGAFEKHPENKAKLYLAALQLGMKMKNAPQPQELRDYPEFTQIETIIRQKEFQQQAKQAWLRQPQLRRDAITAKETLAKANADVAKDSECRELKSQYSTAAKALDNAKKNNADPETLRQLSDELRAAKTRRDEHPLIQAVQQAETAYRALITEMANNYVTYGSSENDTTTAQERRQKLQKHLEVYDANSFFTKTIAKRDENGYPIYLESESPRELQSRITDRDRKNLISEQTRNHRELQYGLKDYIKNNRSR